MKKHIFLLSFLVVILSSCNDWLDVQPRGEETLESMVDSENGFLDILTGCYIKLNSRSLYGEKLTMSNIESLAQMWEINQQTTSRNDDKFLAIYDYENSNAKNTISDIYLKLYNVIVQANTIILNIDSKKDLFSDPVAFSMIKGEAYALRAMCHFDVLRLFGQMPNHPSKKVLLPYAEQVSNKELPTYYSFEKFVEKIESDLNVAEKCLVDVDPVFKQGMTYSGNDNNLFDYRGNYLNYYAVKALQSRLYLYTNQTEKAYAAAKVVYTARPVVLSGSEDISHGYLSSPSEALFALTNNKLIDYSDDILGMGYPQIQEGHLYSTTDRINALFPDPNDNRYLKVWSRSSVGVTNDIRPVIKKYWYDIDASWSDEVKRIKLDVIPLIRMSEIYLTLMETAPNIAESNTYYKEYMSLSRGIGDAPDLTTDQLKESIVDEIRREFFAEGHMFYTYKRLGVHNMMWGSVDMSENEFSRYIIPLPESEFNPSL